MAKFIQWIKSHMLVVICSSLGVLSLTGIVLGGILPTAKADLAADQQVYSSLQAVADKPANAKAIDDVRRQQNEVRRLVQRFLADAAKTNPHTLLHPDVFPKVKERFAPNVFKDRCDQKRRELLALLNAKDPPSSQEVEEYRAEMLKLRQKESREKGEVPAGQIGKAPNLLNPGLQPGLVGPQGLPAALESLPPEERVKQDPNAGAAIKRAHEVFCYANIDALDPRNRITIKDPPVELMWESQLSLWVQEDILQALSKINNEAAAQLPEQNRWVAYLPVKHLMYIAVGNYLRKSEGAAMSASPGMSMGQRSTGSAGSELMAPNPPQGGAEAAFTKRAADANVDVVHLALGLVIDANALLRIIDEIEKTGFYTSLLVNYEVVDHNPSYHDYIYGPGPVIRVRLEFEHCILREKLVIQDKKYLDLMPETIKTGAYVSDASRGGGPGAGPGPGPGPGMRPGGLGPPGRRGGREDF